MRSTKRIHPYVSPDIEQRLHAYCAAKGSTESAVVQAALQDYLDGDLKDNELIVRRLDRLGRAAVRQQRDVDVLSEAFATYVRMWSAYLPELSGPDLAAARSLGTRRYQQFADVVAQQFAGGARLVLDIVKEDPSADLADLAAAGTPLPGTGR